LISNTVHSNVLGTSDFSKIMFQHNVNLNSQMSVIDPIKSVWRTTLLIPLF